MFTSNLKKRCKTLVTLKFCQHICHRIQRHRSDDNAFFVRRNDGINFAKRFRDDLMQFSHFILQFKMMRCGKCGQVSALIVHTLAMGCFVGIASIELKYSEMFGTHFITEIVQFHNFSLNIWRFQLIATKNFHTSD